MICALIVPKPSPIAHGPRQASGCRFDEAAATRLNLDDGLRKVLRPSAKEITVHIPVQLDDGRLEVFTGYRVQHSSARGRAKAASVSVPMSRWTKCAPWRTACMDEGSSNRDDRRSVG